jgi:hypothetical protein
MQDGYEMKTTEILKGFIATQLGPPVMPVSPEKINQVIQKACGESGGTVTLHKKVI